MKKEYPQLRLILVLPCEDQTRGWRSEDIAVYEDIKRRSDNSYYDWCCEYCGVPCDKRDGWCEKFVPKEGDNDERCC